MHLAQWMERIDAHASRLGLLWSNLDLPAHTQLKTTSTNTRRTEIRAPGSVLSLKPLILDYFFPLPCPQLRTVFTMCAPQGQFCLGCPKTPPPSPCSRVGPPKLKPGMVSPLTPGLQIATSQADADSPQTSSFLRQPWRKQNSPEPRKMTRACNSSLAVWKRPGLCFAKG